jgi:hypothetical protein
MLKYGFTFGMTMAIIVLLTAADSRIAELFKKDDDHPGKMV